MQYESDSEEREVTMKPEGNFITEVNVYGHLALYCLVKGRVCAQTMFVPACLL